MNRLYKLMSQYGFDTKRFRRVRESQHTLVINATADVISTFKAKLLQQSGCKEEELLSGQHLAQTLPLAQRERYQVTVLDEFTLLVDETLWAEHLRITPRLGIHMHARDILKHPRVRWDVIAAKTGVSQCVPRN